MPSSEAMIESILHCRFTPQSRKRLERREHRTAGRQHRVDHQARRPPVGRVVICCSTPLVGLSLRRGRAPGARLRPTESDRESGRPCLSPARRMGTKPNRARARHSPADCSLQVACLHLTASRPSQVLSRLVRQQRCQSTRTWARNSAGGVANVAERGQGGKRSAGALLRTLRRQIGETRDEDRVDMQFTLRRAEAEIDVGAASKRSLTTLRTGVIVNSLDQGLLSFYGHEVGSRPHQLLEAAAQFVRAIEQLCR